MPVLASLTLQPPAIIYVLYCEGVNKSATAPLSVPSVSETSALAFCSVIYARLLPKMSFLSPTAPSACERAWHLSVFINFKDAFACFLSFTLLVFLSLFFIIIYLCSSFYFQDLLLFYSLRLSLSIFLSLRSEHFWCHLFPLFVFISFLFCCHTALQENQ